MSVMITGGCGHIGPWIAAELVQQGKKVLLVDQAISFPDHLEPYRDSITPVSADVLDLPALVDIVKNASEEVDGIIHNAAVIDRREILLHPHRSVRTNIEGTLNCLEVARLFKLRRMVYASSGSVYGSPKGILDEKMTPERPNEMYGVTKLAGEHLGLQYHKLFGVDFASIRFYFVYGSGKFPLRSSNLLYRALFGPLEGLREIRLEKGGDLRVDWTYVRDAAHGAVLAYNKGELQERVFNISSGVAYGVREVMEAVRRYAPVDSKVEVGPGMILERGGPMDISRARSELGFEPSYSLEEGVKEYANWLAGRMGT
jgi:nucleoside-diphosphate-sugar epimerase